MVTASELSGIDVGLYAAIATIIPVFLLAYTVGLTSFAQRLGSSYDTSLKVLLLNMTNFATHRKGSLSRSLRALLGGSGSLLALIVVTLAVALPVLGEYEALHALAVGSASPLTKALSQIGVAVALLVVVVPIVVVMLRSFSFLPVISYLLQVKRDLREVQSLYSRWRRGDADRTDWMSDQIVFRLIRGGGGNPSEWAGSPNLANFVSVAWGDNTYPRWDGALLLRAGKLIVYDQVRNEDGASVFTIVDHKVTELVVYRDRDQARAENYGKANLVQEVARHT